MKIICEHCQQLNIIDDSDVRAYVNRLTARSGSDAKLAAQKANASKPRPGAKGKPKPRKPKPATEE